MTKEELLLRTIVFYLNSVANWRDALSEQNPSYRRKNLRAAKMIRDLASKFSLDADDVALIYPFIDGVDNQFVRTLNQINRMIGFQSYPLSSKEYVEHLYQALAIKAHANVAQNGGAL
jgi:hypothetical protein